MALRKQRLEMRADQIYACKNIKQTRINHDIITDLPTFIQLQGEQVQFLGVTSPWSPIYFFSRKQMLSNRSLQRLSTGALALIAQVVARTTDQQRNLPPEMENMPTSIKSLVY